MKNLTAKRILGIEGLLNVAEKVSATDDPVLRGNKKFIDILQESISDPILILEKTGNDISNGNYMSAATRSMVGFNMFLTPIFPLSVLASLYDLIRKNSGNKQKQANLCIELAESQQRLYEKYNSLKKEYESTDKEKSEIIKKYREKLAECEVIMAAQQDAINELKASLSIA